MSDSASFASLSPTLLARKGGAKPAMRPQLQPLDQFQGSAARALEGLETDLGWNDMGDDGDHASGVQPSAQIVPFNPEPAAEFAAAPPPVLAQRSALSRRLADPLERRSALADGRRAAFTLRVDAERHLKLRLACTIKGASAQQLVTEALDRLLDELPDIAELAARVSKAQH
ncbi:hypothetical protein ACOYW6_01140 [Parablastomonas sp. CN1-191]|uniref:hypothetical protein n=1 Tax=Parablastomonas sp. CN1-191 TaxID=3400908 RepID=UPI003BF7F563